MLELLSMKTILFNKLGSFALFAGGYNTTFLYTTEKYAYVNDSITAGRSLKNALGMSGTGCGNSQLAVFAYNYSYEQYTYSSDTAITWLDGSSNRILHGYTGAAGNESLCIFAGEYSTYYYSDARVYAFATRTLAVTTSLSEGRGRMASLSDGFNCFFSGGSTYSAGPSAKTEKYSLSTFSRSLGTSLSSPRDRPTAAGNAVFGIIAGGLLKTGTQAAVTKTSTKYEYPTDLISVGQNLSIPKDYLSGSGNSTFGIFSGGRISSTEVYNSCDKYDYSNSAVSTSGYLAAKRYGHASASSSPGWSA